MKRTVLLVALFYFVLSCDRYPEPSVKTLEDYSFAFLTNQGSKYFAGEWVSDSIKFYAVKSNNPLKDSLKVLFDVAKGGGNITIASAYTDKNGFAYTGWKLGSGSFEQKLTAKTYDGSRNYLTSSDLTEYGFKNNAWDTCKLFPDGSINGMVADTVYKVTFMVTNNTVYRQGDRYYQWEQVNDPALVYPRTINMDRNGVIYVSTWSGEMIKSTDHGVSWKTCTKPYPDRPYYIYDYVSNDNYVWVFAWDHQIKFSKDGGTTWTEIGALSGLAAGGLGDIYRLKDGSLLFSGSDCCNIYRSFDDGLSWTIIKTPDNLLKLYVSDKDEIFVICQGPGIITIYKSSDYGVSYSSLYAVAPQFVTEMDNIFNRWGDFYYVLMPGFGILKSSDLNNYELYWTNYNLNNLFIDHNGVLIAKDWNMNTVYYRKNTGK
ncbi:MAG: sialidase family protein [Bacteroidales bacterium]